MKRRPAAGKQGADGHFHDPVFRRPPVLLLSHAVRAGLRAHDRLIKKRGQIVDVRVGHQDNAPPAPAVPAIGPPFGHELFAAKTAATVAAVPGLGVNFNMINKHGKTF